MARTTNIPEFGDFGFGAGAGQEIRVVAPGGGVRKVTPQNLGRGEFFAEGPAGMMARLGGQTASTVRQEPAFSPTRLAQVARQFRTQDQQAQVEQMQRQRERLAALQQRTALLSMTREGRQRVADEAAAEARQTAKEARRFEENKELFRLKYGAPAEVKAKGQIGAAQARGAATLKGQELKGEQEATRQAEELKFRREELASKEERAAADIQAATDLVRQKGLAPGTPEYAQAQGAAIEQIRAKAEAEGDADAELAILRQAHKLQQMEFKGQQDVAFSPEREREGITEALPTAPAPVGGAQAATGVSQQDREDFNWLDQQLKREDLSADRREELRDMHARLRKKIRGR